VAVSRIFWDTNLWVYLLEDYGEFSQQVADLRGRMLERGDELCTSALSLGEVLVKPFEERNESLARAFEDAIARTTLVIPFDSAAARTFARIRTNRSIRPPDAIQLACAAQAQSDLFITNDDRLTRTRVPGIQFITSLANAPI
jgi:predicted nucleic acid-binding protein